MRRAFQIAVLVCVVGFQFESVFACLWDTDTLAQERVEAPTVLETILGKFPRHSAAYYQWRLKDRLELLDSDPENDRLLDDVAVSYEKLGDHDAAIAVAKEQLSRNPNRYETLANLGTFLIHSGELEKGVSYIAKALEVNPDAHFGREQYQLLLVKFLLDLSKEGTYTLPLGEDRLSDGDSRSKYPFIGFVGTEVIGDFGSWISKEDRQKAVQAILGMMRFSQHDHPVLLDVLGELLEVDGHHQLAFRCYMRAAEKVEDSEAKRGYEMLAQRVIKNRVDDSSLQQEQAGVMTQFEDEKADADVWFAELTSNEAKWIAAGEDVDAMFKEHYFDPPVALFVDESYALPTQENQSEPSLLGQTIAWAFVAFLAAVGIVATLWIAFARGRRNQKSDLLSRNSVVATEH